MTIKSAILSLLMQQSPEYLSGEQMAQQLEVSRTAVWKAINELKKAGHLINSNRKGYQYQQSDLLSVEGIQLQLSSETPDLLIHLVDSSASTMKDAKLAAVNGEAANVLVVADMQEAPKGRFGRPFFAKAGQGIYMSLLLHPNQRFEEMAQYTIIVAAAVSKAIKETTGIETEIKWVNDIYKDEKKICGILSEAISDVESGQITDIVIGLGLNFSIAQGAFPDELQEKATSLFSEHAPTITRNELIAAIWTHFFALLKQPPEDVLTYYRHKSLVLGKKVTFTQAGETYQGVAETIDDHGELIVALPDGTKKRLASGEISLSAIQ